MSSASHTFTNEHELVYLPLLGEGEVYFGGDKMRSGEMLGMMNWKKIELRSKEGLAKQMQYANNRKIPFVVLIGSKEIESKQVTYKNMTSGEQKTGPLADLVKAITL